jgi:hypothetical protein
VNTTQHNVWRDNRRHNLFSYNHISPAASGGAGGGTALCYKMYSCATLLCASAEGQASLGRWGQPHLLCCPARKSPGGPQARRGRGRSPGGSQHRHGAEPLGLELAGQLMGQLRRNEANLFHRQAAAASEASQRSGISPSNNQMQKTGAGDLCHSNVYLPLLIWSVIRFPKAVNQRLRLVLGCSTIEG